jgi:hypothetical protein
MGQIYISFPAASQDSYPLGDRTSWSQVAHFVHRDLCRKFSNVHYLRYGSTVPMTKDDVLISNVPNRELQKIPGRSIIVDNDNFEVGKWKYGKFTKYGINAETDCTYRFNSVLEGLFGAVLKTSEVAIRKWDSNHQDVLERKQFLLHNIQNVCITPHPIDKDYFGRLYRPDIQLDTLRMLVYNAPWRKNAVQLVELLRNNFPEDAYRVVSSINKPVDEEFIVGNFAYFAHTSYSEGFPYLANELLCQGLVLFGHEEWWDPYGFDALKWTYNPELQDRNLSHLGMLLSDDFKSEYYKMRRSIVSNHLDRTDNNWNHLTDQLANMVERLLSAPG